jgi:tRNA-intron endonuclease, archaea type
MQNSFKSRILYYLMVFPIYLERDRIFSNSQIAFTIQKSRGFGEIKDGKIFYSDFEGVYLRETKKAEMFQIKNIKNKKISKEDLLNILSKKDKDFLKNYIVYKDLTTKGYLVKTGSKFGSEFRVYDKGKTKNHAKWILYVLKQNEKIIWENIIAKTRISHSTAKKLLVALVDFEENIIYYEIDWIKP